MLVYPNTRQKDGKIYRYRAERERERERARERERVNKATADSECATLRCLRLPRSWRRRASLGSLDADSTMLPRARKKAQILTTDITLTSLLRYIDQNPDTTKEYGRSRSLARLRVSSLGRADNTADGDSSHGATLLPSSVVISNSKTGEAVSRSSRSSRRRTRGPRASASAAASRSRRSRRLRRLRRRRRRRRRRPSRGFRRLGGEEEQRKRESEERRAEREQRSERNLTPGKLLKGLHRRGLGSGSSRALRDLGRLPNPHSEPSAATDPAVQLIQTAAGRQINSSAPTIAMPHALGLKRRGRLCLLELMTCTACRASR